MSKTKKAVFKVLIEAPIEDVWRELTRTDALLPFFFNSRMETPGLEVGAPMRMQSASGKYTGVIGEILEYTPPTRYSHTFRFTNLDDSPCRVTYELKEVAGGVEFKLIADGIPVGTKTEKYMTQGGDYIVKTLKAVVEERSLPFQSRFIILMCKLTERFTPAKCRSELWPLGNVSSTASKDHVVLDEE